MGRKLLLRPVTGSAGTHAFALGLFCLAPFGDQRFQIQELHNIDVLRFQGIFLILTHKISLVGAPTWPEHPASPVGI